MISARSRVLITGADGFVGWHVLQHLQSEGYTDLHLTSFAPSDRLRSAITEGHLHILDLTNGPAVQNLLADLKPDAIIHLAAWSAVNGSFENAAKIMQLNTTLQLVMLEAMRDQAPQARLLCIGSGHAYGPIRADLDAWKVTEDYPLNPDNPYSVSKLTQEMLSRAYATAYSLDVIFIRPFNQIGPGQRGDFAVASFAQQIVAVEQGQQPSVRVGNLEAVRDFTDVRDAAVAYRLLLEKGETRQTYNLGSGQGVKMQHVLEVLRAGSEKEIPVETDPQRLRPSDIPVFVADNSRLQKLGWQQSYSLQDTLHDILKEARQSSENTTK